jgi:hypothetical protein
MFLKWALNIKRNMIEVQHFFFPSPKKKGKKKVKAEGELPF